MMMTNLKIVVVVVLTLAAYTLLANMIPQIQSEVPEELDLSGAVTPEELVAAGERLYNGAGGCVACHGLGTRAPNLLTSQGDVGPIGSRCADRRPEMSCKEYLHESLVDPTAHVVEGFAAIMPDASRTLGPDQIWTLVAFLQAQGGEVTVTAEDIAASSETESAGGQPAGGGATVATASDPRQLMTELGCLACHQLGGEGNAIGPGFDDVGARRDAAYIRESILNPAAQASPGYEALTALMPPNFGEQMTAAQLEALVQFLAAQQGGG